MESASTRLSRFRLPACNQCETNVTYALTTLDGSDWLPQIRTLIVMVLWNPAARSLAFDITHVNNAQMLDFCSEGPFQWYIYEVCFR